MLQHEGEVKLCLTCENLTRPGRWTLLAGHSSAGWMPAPVPLAYAALAASTVTTLRQFVSREAWPSAGFHVEIIPQSAGNRDHAQTAAAAGAINPRRVVRRKEIGSVPFSTKASYRILCVKSPEGGYNHRVEVGGP